MGNEKIGLGKNDNFRRKWNPTELGKKAQIFEMKNQKVGKTQIENKNQKPMKELLKAREYLVDLEKQVGKSFVINKAIGTVADGGYYCDVCDCSLRDSSNFLDHINGKKHQANLGISMKVERSSLNQVKERIKLMSQKKQQEKNKVIKEYDIDESIAIAKDKEKEEKIKKKENKKQHKLKLKQEFDEHFKNDDNDEMMKIMGFSSFSSSKK